MPGVAAAAAENDAEFSVEIIQFNC